MAELVGAFAASHGPLIARDWEKLSPRVRDWLTASFDELGRRLKATRPDVLVIVAPDHWTNFFIENLPTVCIGIGPEHDGPPEPFLKPRFPHPTLAGHGGLARHLLRTALASGFDPALSHHLALDHGFCLPLWRMALDPMPAIVPFVLNSLEDPMPSMARCLEWGRLIGKAVASYPENLRVAVLASGGLSHSIGEPTMGEVEEDLDRACLRLLSAAPDGELTGSLEELLRNAGNGGHEIRNWVVAHGAVGSRGFDPFAYAALPEVFVGCGFAEWKRA
jgi:aromatic ring-opening dioxygenase catalytic subunit (LigB family)